MGLFHHQQETIERGAEAQAVRDRLSEIPLVRTCDRARVESALAAHLAALGLDPRPVRWIEATDADQAARQGFLAFWAASYKRGRPEAPGMTLTATNRALFGPGLKTTGVVGPALAEEKEADRSVKKAVRHAVFGFGSALTRAESDLMDIDTVGPSAGLGRATAAARAALADKGIHQQFGFISDQMEAKRIQGEMQLKEEVQIASGPAQALEAANWLARAHVLGEAGGSTDAHDRLVQAYLPLVDAVEAGLWLFWVTQDDVIAVAAPEG
ncbi:MAG: hypothetical protein WDA75_25820 [Candidatus Latescibacterota bacterium]|jgi:hypothetical protein